MNRHIVIYFYIKKKNCRITKTVFANWKTLRDDLYKKSNKSVSSLFKNDE